jgi:3-deoxy-7-phosphoheptulonate synthase
VREAEVRGAVGVRPDARQRDQDTRRGIKTRSFDAIRGELESDVRLAHRGCGTHLGGVHFELTGEDVTECVGGATGITEHTCTRNYATLCDPRLNYQQALELAFALARRLSQDPAAGGR